MSNTLDSKRNPERPIGEDFFGWARGREHLRARHARFFGELLAVAAAHAPDRGAANDLRIASAAAFDAFNRLERIQQCGSAPALEAAHG